MLAEGGFDPPTFGLWDQWNTSILPRLPVGVQIWSRTRISSSYALPLSYLDLLFVFLLPDVGLEPTTTCLKGTRSKPTELTGFTIFGPTGTRTQDATFKVSSANHYTIRPLFCWFRFFIYPFKKILVAVWNQICILRDSNSRILSYTRS